MFCVVLLKSAFFLTFFFDLRDVSVALGDSAKLVC